MLRPKCRFSGVLTSTWTTCANPSIIATGRRCESTNLIPAVQCVQASLPNMREKGWGRIVNLSSLVVLGVAQRSTYAAA
jgi:NAD(P)-dependent dehydrogenase (short-subunit alcohol dehydrogenase family)